MHWKGPFSILKLTARSSVHAPVLFVYDSLHDPAASTATAAILEDIEKVLRFSASIKALKRVKWKCIGRTY